jgi:hypothetical protein
VPRRAPTPHATHDRLLVFGVAAAALGVVMVSQAVLLAKPPPHVVPREHAALMPAKSAAPAPAERLTAETSSRDRVPPMPAAVTAISGVTTPVAACLPHFDFDDDPRLVLAAMGPQRRAFTRQRLVAPNKRDVPMQFPALAGAVVSAASVEASPQAVEHSVEGRWPLSAIARWVNEDARRNVADECQPWPGAHAPR